ncbi:MAG: hypothetical protein K8H88_28020 [Sandaracinaceae bacterium]|nr:hypothetical protein [Sandaracinaceae bacterium]
MKRPGSVLLLSLPNSGSTWTAELMAKRIPGHYAMEYFNPLRNPERGEILKRNFGCELIECYRNIVTTGDEHVHADIERTWDRDGYTFTKEVFSPAKLPIFVQHFERVVVLLRRTEGVFPPSRLRIWAFYEHAWHALREAGHMVRAETDRDRAYEAHQRLSAMLRRDARALGVPVVDYEEFFGDDDTVLEAARILDPNNQYMLAANLIMSRRPKGQGVML